MKQAVQSALEELREEIESLSDDVSWSVPVEHALSYFPLRLEDYYRFAYARRNADDYASPDDRLTPDNFPDFLRFLEHRGWPDAGKFFFRAGYCLGDAQRTDLLEFFFSVAVSRLQNHQVDRDLLENSLAACRRTEDGFDFYCAAAIDLDELLCFIGDLYLDHNRIARHSFSSSRVRQILRAEVRSGSIRAEDLFQSLFRVLRERALDWGLIQEDFDFDPPPVFQSPAMKAALRFMGFRPEKPPGRGALKDRYRELMKKFHPDVNPAGGEKSRQLNSAYSLLLTGFE